MNSAVSPVADRRRLYQRMAAFAVGNTK